MSSAPMILTEQSASMPNMGLMAGKRGLVMGIANDKSIAWGIAQALASQGAEIALTYQNEAILKRIQPLSDQLNASLLLPCDVEQEADLDALAEALKTHWGSFDFIVHSLAYANRDSLKNRFVDTSKADFLQSVLISCFSLTEICKRTLPLLNQGASVLTMTFIGSRRVMPHYNLMGVSKAALEASVRYLAADLGSYSVRVNALSAGPMRTISGAAISDARRVFRECAEIAPLGENASLEDVGRVGLYLLSPLSSGVTGEIHHVDGGYHAMGLKSD